VLLNIAPATKFEYEVNIPEDHPSGTFWYHAHRHGSTATQVASGASGALIIRGNRKYTGGAPGDVDTILRDATGKQVTEQVFLFQQIPYACFANATWKTLLTNADGTWSCPPLSAGPHTPGVVENFNEQLNSPTAWDVSGRFTSINGAVQPTLSGIKAGEIQRWRFIHAGIHDTINVQVTPMVTKGPNAKLAFQGGLAGTPAAQAKIIEETCPVTVPDSSQPPIELVPEFEIAQDGLTRSSIRRIGGRSVSGGIGTNFLQPGYRSDVLIVFPHDGTYCILNQAATPKERVSSGGGGGQGPSVTQLLATVVVQGGKPVTTDLEKYVEQSLFDGNKGKGLPDAALKGLLTGDLTPWRGMPDLKDEMVMSKPQKADFLIGPRPTGCPNSPLPFGFYINCAMYDPDRVDFTRQVGTTDDWQLTSHVEPHIFHIHVNPFEVMDVIAPDGKSIFGAHGECLVAPDELGLQNQYCGMWHTFRDTVFVQNDYQVMMRTKYDRYIGEFVIHCHILDHEDGGMMANIEIVPDASAAGGGLGMPGMKHSPPEPK
jgi:FtsP/CotA-like multicopper oxidase with cupredoxin domain